MTPHCNQNPSQKSLKIAILVRSFIASGGGAERYAISLAKEVAKRHEVHVFAQTIDPSLIDDRIQFHKIPMLFSKPRWINQLWFAIATQLATDKSFDIIHSHDNTWLGNVQTVHVLPIKYALFYRRTGLLRLFRWLKVLTSPRLICYMLLEKSRFRVKKKRAIIATSETLQSQIVNQYPKTEKHVSVISPGVTQLFQPADDPTRENARKKLGLPVEGNCILFVANDFLRKGLKSLIKALPFLPSNYYLAVVGNSKQSRNYHNLMTEQAVTQRVFFLGRQSDMTAVYQCADCLVHPTLEDTFAMVVLEAMAHSLPVAVSGQEYCGISALLTNNHDALILDDPTNSAEIAIAIGKLCTHDRSYSLIENGLQFVSRYVWQHLAEQQESIYQLVANETFTV